MPNARTSERAPFLAEVDVLTAGAPGPRRVWGSDVSEGGVFLQTTHPFRVGDRVSLRFDLDDHEIHVRAAEVMWVRPFEPVALRGQVPGAGLKFVAIDADDRAVLRRFILPRQGTRASPASALVAQHATAGAQPEAETLEGLSDIPDLPRFLVPEEHDTLEPEPSGPESGGATSWPPGTGTGRMTDPPRASRGSVWGLSAPGSERPAPVTLSPGFEERMSVEARHAGLIPALDLRFDDTNPRRARRASHEDTGGAGAFDLEEFRDTLPPDAGTTSDEGVFAAAAAHDLLAPPEGGAHLSGRTVEAGTLALHELPEAVARRSVPGLQDTTRWLLPLAVGLLCTGVGVAMIGDNELPSAGGRAEEMQAALDEPALGAGASSSTEEGGREDAAPGRAALDTSPPLGAPVVAASAIAAPPAAAPPEAAPPNAAPPNAAPTNAAPGAATPPVDSPTVAARPLEAAPASAARVAPPAAAPVTPAAAAPTAAASPRGPAHETLELAVGNAQVVRSFTLAGPDRLVVDLHNATLPRELPATTGRIRRVRLGTPAPGTQRVVLELGAGRAARDVVARVVKGALRVTFR